MGPGHRRSIVSSGEINFSRGSTNGTEGSEDNIEHDPTIEYNKVGMI